MKLKFVLFFILCFLIGGFVVTDKVCAQKEQQNVTWIKDLEPIEEGGSNCCLREGAGQLKAKAYVRSMIFTSYAVKSNPYTAYRTYNIAGKYDYFETIFGVDDTSYDKTIASMEIIGDGKTLYSTATKKLLEEPEIVSVNIKGVIRLKIVVNISATSDENSDNGIATVGDPKLIIGKSSYNSPKEENPKDNTNNSSTNEETCEGGSVVIEPKSLEELANKLAEQVKDSALIKEGEKLQLAVAKFKLVKICDSAVADNTLEDLSTYLLKTKVFKLIERGQLDKALQEIGLGESGFIDPEKAIELGKMVGAQAILIGSVSDRGTFVVINARIINTKTGEADIAENVEMRK